MAYVPNSGSVVAFQSDPTKLVGTVSVVGSLSPSSVLVLNQVSTLGVNVLSSPSIAVNIIAGSIAATFTPPANQSVSGTVGASIIGLPPFVLGGSTNASVITVGTAAPNQSVSGTVQADVRGSVAVAIISGSIAATFTPPANQSVSGTVLVGNTNVNVSGSVVAFQGTTPWANTNVGSIITVGQGSIAVNIVAGSIAATFTPPANQSVSGTVNTLPLGTIVTSLVSTVPSSVIVGTSIFGQLPAGTAPLGSVATLQGTNPWLVSFGNSSIIAVPVGSVIAVLQSSSIITLNQAQSIVGTYSEDATHTSADKGLFVLGVRNDTVASFVSADLEYNPFAHDSAGRAVIKPFSPDESTFNYFGSVVSGSVTLIKASAIGKRNYLTDFWIANTGSVSTLITFQGGDTSIVGYTIAPAGGGSNSQGTAIPMKTTPGVDLAFKMGTMASVLYVTATGYQAP